VGTITVSFAVLKDRVHSSLGSLIAIPLCRSNLGTSENCVEGSCERSRRATATLAFVGGFHPAPIFVLSVDELAVIMAGEAVGLLSGCACRGARRSKTT